MPPRMRRLAGHVFTILSAISLLLCFAFIVMCARSLYYEDTWEYLSRDERLVMIISKRGRVDLLYIAKWSGDEPGMSHRTSASSALGGTDYSHRFLGFGADVQLNGGRFINVPYWFLACVAAALPAVAIRRIRARRRIARQGLCPRCGYDLRASPERCPECGAVARRGR
jgi:hypothetical protein